MKNKTKAILAVVFVALCFLGYFFINTTAAMERAFNKIGKIAIFILIVAIAVAAIVLINKAKIFKNEQAAKKAAKKEAKTQKTHPAQPDVLEADHKTADETVYAATDLKEESDVL